VSIWTWWRREIFLALPRTEPHLPAHSQSVCRLSYPDAIALTEVACAGLNSAQTIIQGARMQMGFPHDFIYREEWPFMDPGSLSWTPEQCPYPKLICVDSVLMYCRSVEPSFSFVS
jgi:hypothetical protein